MASITEIIRAISRRLRSLTTAPAAADLENNHVVILRNSDEEARQMFIKDSRLRPFFAVAVADLGGGHLGYAGAGYDGLDDNYDVDAGGTSGYSAIGAISEQVRNLVSSTFTRVGTFAITDNIRGLGAYNGNLYRLEDTGTQARIVGFNPDDGTTISTSSNASPAENAAQGFTVLNGVAYFYGNQRNRFYAYDIDSETWTQLSTDVNLRSVQGLAHANGNVYVMYHKGDQARYISQVNTSDGSISGEQQFSGLESGDQIGSLSGLTSFKDVIYVSSQAGANAHVYSVDPSNGNLTTIGDVNPSNAQIEHLAQLGDYIYGWNDTDNGLYRAVAEIGVRWVVIFPNTTTEVDDDDLTLQLAPGEGEDIITLTRDENITDAIVFASEIGGDPMHTIAVGDNEEMALYKADRSQLFMGSRESILREVQLKDVPLNM